MPWHSGIFSEHNMIAFAIRQNAAYFAGCFTCEVAKQSFKRVEQVGNCQVSDGCCWTLLHADGDVGSPLQCGTIEMTQDSERPWSR